MFENGGHLARNILSDVPKTEFLISRKKIFAFFGGATLMSDVPKTGVLISGKKLFAFSGGATLLSDVPKTGFLISRKQLFAFPGGASILNGIELRHPFRIQVPHNFVLLRQLERPSHVVLRLQLL